MTDEKIIDWLKDSFGGYKEKRVFTNKNYKDAYGWRIDNKNVVPILKKVIPYLKIKRPQAEIILKRERLKDKIQNKGERIGLHYSTKVSEEIEKLYWDIRALNKRGVSCTLND